MRLPRWLNPLLIAIAWCIAAPLAPDARHASRPIVLDHARLIDGTGAAPRDGVRVTVEGNRIASVEPSDGRPIGSGADVVDLSGRVLMPGLIDLHFHIERDPKLAIRQLVNGVTSFRDPGQWNDRFDGLRQIIADEHLGGPRMALAGPHIDGEHPAYPADSVVARDAEEARRAAERNVAEGASAIKIYFRLPLASAAAVIGVCHAHNIPCTAHLEILDAGEVLEAGLDAIEHITSFGTAIAARERAEQYRQQVLADNAARRDGRYALFADARLDGPEAERLFGILERHRPFVNPTLAVFEVRAGVPREGRSSRPVGGRPRLRRHETSDARGVPSWSAHHDGRSQQRAVCRARRGALARDRVARRVWSHAAAGSDGGDIRWGRVTPAGRPRRDCAGQARRRDRAGPGSFD